MAKKLFCISFLFVLASTSLVDAWHDGGHKTVAAIAFRLLTPSEQKAIAQLLKKHPRYADEFEAKMPSQLDDTQALEWVFQQAAVFPDIARGYHGQLADQFHRPLWHYINSPLFLSSADRAALHPESSLNVNVDVPATLGKDANVIQVIRKARLIIADTSVDPAERALMLSWLFHTVGDIHQPLHSVAMFSQGLFPKGDHGGNSIPTKQMENLHSLWDDFPGGRLSFRTVHNQATVLMNNHALSTQGSAAMAELSEVKWMEESKAMADNLVYDDEVMTFLKAMEMNHQDIEHHPLVLSADYLKTADAACDQRIIQAGYRLSAILSAIFD